MTKRSIIALTTVAAFMLSLGLLQAAGTKEQAKELVQKAIAYYKANGKDKAFAEINNPKGMFVKEDLYVTVYDMSGVCVAHGFQAKRIGKNLMDEKDPDGKAFVKERVEAAKANGSGWQDYKFMNPTTYKKEQKTAYFEKVDGFIFSCGAYK